MSHLEESLDQKETLASLSSNLKLALDFVAEAAVNQVHLNSHSKLHSVTARRAQRLKQWSVGSASKRGICSIPFAGKYLFGRILEEAIKRVSGKKLDHMPQENPNFNLSGFQNFLGIVSKRLDLRTREGFFSSLMEVGTNLFFEACKR